MLHGRQLNQPPAKLLMVVNRGSQDTPGSRSRERADRFSDKCSGQKRDKVNPCAPQRHARSRIGCLGLKPLELNASATHWLTYESSLRMTWYVAFVMGDSSVVLLIGCFMFCRKPNMSSTFFIPSPMHFDISKKKSHYRTTAAFFNFFEINLYLSL